MRKIRRYAGFVLLLSISAATGVTRVHAEASPDQTSQSQGTISGKVLFEGAAPGQKIVAGDTVVYLVGEGLDGKAPPAKPAVLDQDSLTFVPHVVVTPVGVPVEFRNNDSVMHNVHSSSSANPVLNKTQLAKGKFRVVFNKPEVIHVGCDIHTQMSAYIVVVPNPLSARPNADGTFSIANVPPGKYKLISWHEKYELVTKDVEIAAGGATVSAELDFGKPQGQ